MESIHFHKYHGAGNDFILIDARASSFMVPPENFIRKMCDRHFGIGADGLMLLMPSASYDFSMKYYNSDGREGSMCGNGGRCITAFARKCGIVKKNYVFEAIDGIHNAEFTSETTISLRMNDITEMKILDDGIFVNTGSPHFILLHDDPHRADMNLFGKKYRYDSRFGEGGANINLISYNRNQITIATFERGVEAETLACGTGAVAAAAAVALKNSEQYNEYQISAKGGRLTVKLMQTGITFSDVFLSGPAEFVFEGEMLFLP